MSDIHSDLAEPSFSSHDPAQYSTPEEEDEDEFVVLTRFEDRNNMRYAIRDVHKRITNVKQIQQQTKRTSNFADYQGCSSKEE